MIDRQQGTAEIDIAERIQFQANRGLCAGRIANILDIRSKDVTRLATEYGIKIRSYRKSAKGAWGSPNMGNVPKLPDTPLQRAITALQQRDYKVYEAYIVNGPENTYAVDYNFLTADEVIAKAERFCG